MHEVIKIKFQWSQYGLEYKLLPWKIVSKSTVFLAIPSLLVFSQKKRLILQLHLKKYVTVIKQKIKQLV